MEKVVAKRKVCQTAWQKSKSAEDKHTLDVAKKEVYTAVLAAQKSKLQEVTADLQSEWGPTEGTCSKAVPAMSTRPMTSALRMPSTHPAIRNANHR